MTRYASELWGTDVSGEMLARAGARLAAMPGVHLVETTANGLEGVPDAHFDFVYSIFTFECIGEEEHIASLLHEALRVLKPGGIFKFQVMGVYPGNPFRRHYEERRDSWFGVPFTMADIVALTEGTGFEVLSTYHAHRVSPPSRDRCVDAEHRIWVVARKGDGMDEWERAAWAGGQAITAHSSPGYEVLTADGKMAELIEAAADHPVRLTHLDAPADDAEAIAMIESGRARGARLLFVSRFHVWWFDHYRAFATHMAERYRRVSDTAEHVLISLDGGDRS